jgi:hypothetical protein
MARRWSRTTGLSSLPVFSLRSKERIIRSRTESSWYSRRDSNLCGFLELLEPSRQSVPIRPIHPPPRLFDHMPDDPLEAEFEGRAIVDFEQPVIYAHSRPEPRNPAVTPLCRLRPRAVSRVPRVDELRGSGILSYAHAGSCSARRRDRLSLK